MYSATLPTPPISEDVNANWKNRPTKYRPGSLYATPRSCVGSPLSAKTGRSIYPKSGRKPVHHITSRFNTLSGQRYAV